MKKLFVSIFILFLSISCLQAQEKKDVFFEKAVNNMIRFYYGADYYLVDKNCEFKYIERVSGFDIASNKFDGPFKDFDLNGRAILTGNYNKGSKDGEFKSYYPDGTLKWEATYVNNITQGPIKYYYPDGKPMLELLGLNNVTQIVNYWNKEGEQTIKNGEGDIDITLPILGYTEHGYTKYNVIGSVKNGYQQGLWHTSFISEGAKKVEFIPVMISTYTNGILNERKIDDFFQYTIINPESLNYVPEELLTTAELLQSKNCTFDEHSGFNSFIAIKFMNSLNLFGYETGADETINLSYTVRVLKNGQPYSPTITSSSRNLSNKEKKLFTTLINQIHYYLPSYLNGKPIKDNLNISLQIETKGTNIIIPPVQIMREKGF